jgi:hypothetical protein
MRATKCHRRAKNKRGDAREHIRHGRDCTWPYRTRADQQKHADRDEELPHRCGIWPDTGLCVRLAVK